MKICYVAGPITGIDDYKRPFDAAQRWLEAAGFVVLNPSFLPIGLRSHESYMKICIPMLHEADGIALLPGWKNSKGAVMERDEAMRLGLPVYEVEFDDFCRCQSLKLIKERRCD